MGQLPRPDHGRAVLEVGDYGESCGPGSRVDPDGDMLRVAAFPVFENNVKGTSRKTAALPFRNLLNFFKNAISQWLI